MGLFTRGKTLWLRYRDVDGKWRNESSGYQIGDEALAKEMLVQLEARIAAARSPSRANAAGLLKLREWAERWQDGRKAIATWKDDQGRLDNHIIPALGEIRATSATSSKRSRRRRSSATWTSTASASKSTS